MKRTVMCLCLFSLPAWARDRDKDKVPDEEDRCPDSPGTLQGCADADADGVSDADDRCPGEKGPAPEGCPVRAPVLPAVRDALSLPLTGSCHGSLLQYVSKPTGGQTMLWTCDGELPVELYLPPYNRPPDEPPTPGMVGTLTWGIYLHGTFEGRAWLWIKTDDGRRIAPVNTVQDASPEW